MLKTDTDKSINTMDEVERRDFTGRFQVNRRIPLLFWITIIPMLQVNVREYIYHYFNGLITDTRYFINRTLKVLTAGFIYRILAIN